MWTWATERFWSWNKSCPLDDNINATKIRDDEQVGIVTHEREMQHEYSGRSFCTPLLPSHSSRFHFPVSTFNTQNKHEK